MYIIITLLAFLLLTPEGSPPDTTTSVLSVTAEGNAELPADRVLFNVNINAEEETPEEAYRVHKKREKVLVQLLDKYEVNESDIDFRPISISKNRRYEQPDKESVTYQTHQLVQLTLGNFEVYEKIQLALIGNGFDSFSGQFMTSREEAGKERALRKAVQNAKEKARILADEAGVDLGPIVNIRYGTPEYRPVEIQSFAVVREGSDDLMKYDQTVTLTATVSIDFEITPKGE